MVAVQSFPANDGSIAGDVSLLTSSDSWVSAQIKTVAPADKLDGPTTATLKDGEVWVINSRFPLIFADPANADRTTEFSIVKIPLE